jgi:hypothetical protein
MILMLDANRFTNLANKEEYYWLSAYEPHLFKNLAYQLTKHTPLNEETARILGLIMGRSLDTVHAKRVIDSLTSNSNVLEVEVYKHITESMRVFNSSELAHSLMSLFSKHAKILDAQTFIYGVESIGANSSVNDRQIIVDAQQCAIRALDQFSDKEVEHVIWCVLSMCNTHNIRPTSDVIAILRNNSFTSIPLSVTGIL